MWMVLENSTSDYWNNDRLGERFMDVSLIRIFSEMFLRFPDETWMESTSDTFIEKLIEPRCIVS